VALSLRILLPLPLPAFSFLPPHGAPPPAPGCRVVVPWQSGVRVGVVVGHEPLQGGAALELREAITALDARPFLTQAALGTLGRVAAYTCAAPGTVLANLLPTGLHENLVHEVRSLESLQEGWRSAAEVPLERLEQGRRQGLLEERVRAQEPLVQVLAPVKRPDKGLAGGPQENQRRALEMLWDLGQAESAAAFSRDAGVPESAVRSLLKKGYAEYRRVPAPPPPLPQIPPRTHPPLSGPRLEGVRSLTGGTRAARLEALVPLLQADLQAGKKVLVLAPEHAYLQEAASLLAAFLPLYTLHGELSDAQRKRLWAELSEGGPVVLVGSYLALLAPLEPLGRVVVLEEGAGAFKLTSGCRVFVPTAARFLAEAAHAPLVLTDALGTPETLARTPRAARLRLPDPAPRAHVVDLNEGGNWPLSADLIRVLKQVSERERQAVLLAPRRGFSAALRCAACDYLASCPNCDLPLRYHRERYALRCHQCGHQERAPDLCPACGGAELSPTRAAGTQWVVSAVQALLPGLPVLRFDGDKREDLSDLLAGAPGVLVATTAILRGPPLPNVSLVAVTLLDTFLNLGDFRAEEEAYRLLLNLAELSPERRPLVLLQSFQPEHAVLRAYVRGEGEAFIGEILRRREQFRYPPFAALAKVQLSAKHAPTAERSATWLAGALRTAGVTDEELLGPTPAPVARVKNQYSYQLFVRAAPEELPTKLAPALAYRGAARLRIDVDPRDIAGFLD